MSALKLKKLLSFIFIFLILIPEISKAVESNRISVELNAGDSNHVATRAIELFVLRAGYGHHVIQNFDKYDPTKKRDLFDKLLFDYGSYSDIMYLGRLYDKQIINSLAASFYVEAVDINSDGQTDTKISVGNDSVTILNCSPSDLYGWQLMGG